MSTQSIWRRLGAALGATSVMNGNGDGLSSNGGVGNSKFVARNGANGANGGNGANGANGGNGTNGVNGAHGANGVYGVNSAQGAGGAQGVNDSSAVIGLADKPAAQVRVDATQGGLGASILPWRRPSVDQLREGYNRVVRVLDSMEAHFQRQDRRAEQMNQSLARIADTLENLAGAQTAQREQVASIAGAVDGARQHVRTLSNALDQMPASLMAQAEAVRAVARHMEGAHATEVQMVESMQRFGVAVDTLRESGAAQVAALQRMRQRDDEQKDALKSFVREQNRRMLITLIAGGLGILLAAGAGVWGLLRAGLIG